MIQVWRVMVAGTRNFLRNAWLSTAATVVMTVTLMIIVTSFVATVALNSTIKQITNKLDISVYLQDSITPQQLQNFEHQLKAVPNVAGLNYISKAQALATYKQENANDPALLQAVSETGNPLPASIDVKAVNPNDLASITAVINQPANKALQSEDPQANNRKATINKIASVSRFIKRIGLFGSLIFIVISTLIIFNTIRMAIFTRRDEIEIMKLVGATKWFIRGPFLIEAAMYGIIAAIIALVLAYTLVLGGAPKLSAYIDVNSTIHIFKSYPIFVIGGELIIGIAIGCFSSLLAMSRYLKL